MLPQKINKYELHTVVFLNLFLPRDPFLSDPSNPAPLPLASVELLHIRMLGSSLQSALSTHRVLSLATRWVNPGWETLT